MAENIFKKAKAYVKAHPRTSFQDAIQKVKGKGKVSGVKKRKVAGVRKTAVSGVKRKPVAKKTAVRNVTVKVGRVAGTKRVGAIGAIAKGTKLVNEINRLEKKRAAVTNKELRDIVQLQINANHRKLDSLKRSIR